MSNQTATSIIEFLKARLNRRSVAFFLCLLLSGLFWLLTSLSKEYVDKIEIPVSYHSLPENLLLVNEPAPIVTAEVRGFGFDLLWHWLSFETVGIEVVADPSVLKSYMRSGEKTHYVLTEKKTGKISDLGDKQLEILSISPDTLYLKFQPRYSKKIPVRLNAEITYEKQFGADGQPMIEPAEIEVTGLKEIVSSIEEIITEPQSWQDLDESITAEVRLVNEHDPKQVMYSEEKVSVAINVAEFTEGAVTIPINVNSGRKTVTVFPNQVEVKYQVPLSDFDAIKPEMFSAEVVLNRQSEKQSLLTVSLTNVPKQVRQVRLNPVQVEYIVQQ
jgi:hypothetical protein